MPMMFGGSWLLGGREEFARRFFDHLIEDEIDEMDRMNEEARKEQLWSEDISKEFERLAYERRRMDDEEEAAQDREIALRGEARKEQLVKRSVELAHKVLGYIPWALVGDHMLPLLTPEQRAVLEEHPGGTMAPKADVQPEASQTPVPTPTASPAPVEEKNPSPVQENGAQAEQPSPAPEAKETALPQEPSPRPPEGERLATPEPEMD